MKGKMSNISEIIFQPEGKRCKAIHGMTILDAAKLLGIDLTSICGGHTLCGKCKVIVEKGRDHLSKRTETEKKLLSKNELNKDYRLACVATINGDLIVTIPSESRRGRQRLQVEGIETPVKIETLAKKLALTLPKPSLEDQTADLERLLRILKQYGLNELEIGYNLLRKLPTLLRNSNWTITVTIWNDYEIIDIESAVMPESYGFAVDIGTTKIAGYLMELKTGKLLGKGALMNPQIPFGEDVISRSSYAIEHPNGLRELQNTVIQGINQILANECEKAAISHSHVYETTIVGNTAMHHLFLGISPKSISVSPYVPAIQKSINIQASKLGLKMNPNGYVHVLPVVAGFVGADCIADVLATEIYKSNKQCFMIDIGTNTEVVIGNKERLTAASCASGPAFEGAHIRHGMRAQTGAIEKIWIDPETLDPNYLTIDNAKPRGICGSAIVDAIAEMLKTGIIDTSGKISLDLETPRIRKNPDELEYVLVWKKEATTEEDIVLLQSDIQEIQKAKAAIYTGASLLMKKLNISPKDISKAFIAGAFGTYIDPTNAKTIGLFPDMTNETIQVGNAAGTGARMILLSKDAKKKAEEIQKMIRYLELATDPDFQKEFISALYFPHLDLNRFPNIVKALKATQFRVGGSHKTILEGIKKIKWNHV